MNNTLSKTKGAAVDTAEAIFDYCHKIGENLGKIMASPELLKDLPLVKWLLVAREIGSNINNSILYQKIEDFLDPLLKVTPEMRRNMITSLEASAFVEKIGLSVLDLLNRNQLDCKPTIAGMIFAALAEEKITHQDFWRLLSVLEQINLFQISELSCFAAEESRKEMPDYIQQTYANIGLAWASAGLSKSMFFEPNDLCHLFIKLELDKALHNTR